MTVMSMTGFARVDGSDAGANWYWELRSVNGRGLDVRVRVPPGSDGLEVPIRELIGKRLTRGNVSVRGFWKRGATTIFDVRVTDTDAPSSRGTDPKKVLQRHENEKKDKYQAACAERRRHFTPLVFSVDGMRGAEATAASRRSCISLQPPVFAAVGSVRSY